MNPYRRVGALPPEEDAIGDLSVTTKSVPQTDDDEDVEQSRENATEYTGLEEQRIQFYWKRRFNPLLMNDILAGIYICLGVAILIMSLVFRPANRMLSGTLNCYTGYCFVRDINRSSAIPAHHHYGPDMDAYHPYSMVPLLIGCALIVYGLLILFRITLLIINAGNINNWLVALLCLFGVVHACYHLDRRWLGTFRPIYWSEGVSHSFFEPLFISIAWLLTTFQALTNLPCVKFRKLDYYSDLARDEFSSG
ncbi:hypothetical protein FBUS_03392 [Fasciolopsis buskii]|uniref:Uncharacterized protein n=1 Tax=Fasciolopsis buskii TaxID=27845 RepID=A0A8E0RXM7_9TREM|nr:hypothetical protein FBUS_03392 [Fasciolopsis buski]